MRALVAFLLAISGGVRADDSRFVTYDGMKVHYRSIGTGSDALVLVHGWTCDQTFFREQEAGLGTKVRLVLVDLPGHGASDKPEREYTMELFARAIDAVMVDAGVSRAVLAGHSMGTPVVRQYYRLFPKKTLGLVALDGALRPFITDPKIADAFVSRFQGPDYKEALGKSVDTMFGAGAPAAMKESARTVMTSVPQNVVVSAMKGMLDLAIWTEDPIEVPLLVINAKSPMWTADYEAFVRKLAKRSEYRAVEGAGHFVMLERPEEVNRHLLGFCKRLRISRGAPTPPPALPAR